ncbi:hypothetical protein ABT373_39770 [Streptomyces sp. NPDC000070]|uniref:hypothetical protein n=1 Tax=Streptomyces sp. NPDC000070 TaxID=3154240 RepID=UPI00332F1A9A
MVQLAVWVRLSSSATPCTLTFQVPAWALVSAVPPYFQSGSREIVCEQVEVVALEATQSAWE